MRFTTHVCGALAALLIAAPTAASADESCCSNNACCTMSAACCKQEAELDGVAVLFEMAKPVQPIRQTAVVWFRTPVKVGPNILQGKYIIEHDNERMASGKPCTHIYAADDPRLPVVAFHCTHLTRPRVTHDTVTLRSRADVGISKELTEFQFAGETAAHGVPVR